MKVYSNIKMLLMKSNIPMEGSVYDSNANALNEGFGFYYSHYLKSYKSVNWKYDVLFVHVASEETQKGEIPVLSPDKRILRIKEGTFIGLIDRHRFRRHCVCAREDMGVRYIGKYVYRRKDGNWYELKKSAI